MHEIHCLPCTGRHKEGLQARGGIEERRVDGLTCGFPRSGGGNKNLPHIEGVELLLRLDLQLEKELVMIRPSPSNWPGLKVIQRRRKAVRELHCLHCAGRHEEGLQARGCIEQRREDGLTCGSEASISVVRTQLRYLLSVDNFECIPACYF